MMRKFINQLCDGTSVSEVFHASGKQLRSNRNGNLYLMARLSDRTGSITAMLWNATNQHAERFQNGDYVRVEGTVQLYQDALQIIAKNIEAVDSTTVSPEDFSVMSPQQVEKLWSRLGKVIGELGNPWLRELGATLISDSRLAERLRQAPAAIKNHHAYHGGLLEHTVNLMELSLLVGPRYPEVDTELLVIGALLHDLGKIEELAYESDLSYSDAGQLIGHLVLGVEILDRLVAETERRLETAFPVELVMRLKHMIVSHHGELAYGSPKVPMTPEAIALCYLDNLDAKLHVVRQLISEDTNREQAWTVYHAAIGRKLFKGGNGSAAQPPLTMDRQPDSARQSQTCQ